MAVDQDKTVEIMVSDVGDMTIVLRPSLPFIAEGYRLIGNMIEVFGEDKKISLEIPTDLSSDVFETSQAILLEYAQTGSDSLRETDLLKECDI